MGTNVGKYVVTAPYASTRVAWEVGDIISGSDPEFTAASAAGVLAYASPAVVALALAARARGGPPALGPDRLAARIGDGEYAVITTDATPKVAATINVPDNASVVAEVYVVAKRQTSAATAFFGKRHMVVRSGGGTAADVGAAEDLSSRANGTTWGLTLAASGNNLVATVTGEAGATIRWYVDVKLITMSDTDV